MLEISELDRVVPMAPEMLCYLLGKMAYWLSCSRVERTYLDEVIFRDQVRKIRDKKRAKAPLEVSHYESFLEAGEDHSVGSPGNQRLLDYD